MMKQFFDNCEKAHAKFSKLAVSKNVEFWTFNGSVRYLDILDI